MSNEDALAVLREIDAGTVTLRYVGTDQVANAVYEASNGWRFRVFDDAGQWDYIDAYAPPGGEWVDVNGDNPVLWFDPTPEALRDAWRWGANGYSPTGYLPRGLPR